MFEKACSALLETVMPIVIAWKVGNEIGHGVAAGMIINEDGYFITAGHVLEKIMYLDKDTVAFQKGQSKFDVDYLAIFGSTSAKLVDMYVDPAIDFGIGRLENYSPIPRHQYPVFRQREVKQGELLCRVGYPFIEDMKPSWKNGKFTFGRLMPVPQFVNEALVSRFVKLNTGVFIETSSPGLQGQSAGPLADVNGFICGMQSHTRHYPLGFKGGGKNQVLNVGRAVHVETMKSVFDIQNISYSIERS